MAEALISNRSRDLWSEVKRMKGRSSKSAWSIDWVTKTLLTDFLINIIHCIILSHLIMMLCFVLSSIMFTLF